MLVAVSASIDPLNSTVQSLADEKYNREFLLSIRNCCWSPKPKVLSQLGCFGLLHLTANATATQLEANPNRRYHWRRCNRGSIRLTRPDRLSPPSCWQMSTPWTGTWTINLLRSYTESTEGLLCVYIHRNVTEGQHTEQTE